MADRVVIIQGSQSDDPHIAQIVSALQPYGVKVERRALSAHRTSPELNFALDQYKNSDRTIFITVAGLSDALSGRVAADYSGRVVASPPDYEQFGDAKVFSSSKTPRGIEVKFAKTPQEAAQLAVETLQTYDWSKVGELNRQSEERRAQTLMYDARLQGAEEPTLPHVIFKIGKTRDVYQDLGDGTLLIRGTDRVSAFDVVLPEKIPGKGQALTELSEYWFRRTQDIFPNHLLERVDERTIRVKKADRIDIEWIVRGYIYGSLARAYSRGERKLYGLTLPDGLQLADPFPQPILTPTTKAETGHDEPITKEEAILKGSVKDGREWDLLANATFRLYEFYLQHAQERGIIIPDFKLEFGRVNGEYIQIDEPPTHDSARFWATQFYKVGQRQEGHALDKEFLRQYLLETGYDGNGPVPHLPELVVDQVSRRCRGATEILTRHFETTTGVPADISRFGLMPVEQVLEELKVK